MFASRRSGILKYLELMRSDRSAAARFLSSMVTPSEPLDLRLRDGFSGSVLGIPDHLAALQGDLANKAAPHD